MNTRGAMEIILGLLALQYGLIGTRLYEALILMALLTSIMAGPALIFFMKSHDTPTVELGEDGHIAEC